jgi:hypothetical protein
MRDFLDPTEMVPLGFVVIGGIFAATGLFKVITKIVFLRRALRCPGVVTELREKWQAGHGDSSGQYYYYPILAFRTADGRDVQTEGQVGTTWQRYRPGQQVDITYDPHDPGRAYAGNGASAALIPLVFAAFGGVFLTIGLHMLISDGILARLLGGA